MKKLFLSLALGLLVFGVSNAQDTEEAQHSVSINIPEIFILDIENGSGDTDASTILDLTPNIPTDLEAGQIVDFSKTDASLTLNYTSIVSADETRSVTVGLDSDLPAGIKLEVVAGAIMGGNSVGATGTPTTAVSLASSAVNLITGIGTGFTGDGNTNGHRLTYTLSTDATAFSSIVATDDTPISRVVTYTITN
jgi:hypothetical protein